MASGRLVTPRRIVLSLVLAAAAAGFVVALQSSDTERPPTFTDQAVESVHPGEGQLDLRQARIGIDLKSGFEAVLRLDGVEIPEDQLERIPELGQTFYTPGPGTATGAIAPGRHCATALLWDPAVSSRDKARRYSWCFNVH